MAPPLDGRPRPTTPGPRASLAGQAADDHVQDSDDAVQDGTEDGTDGVNDAHQARADSVEDAGDLDAEGMLASMLRDGQLGVTYARDDGTHFVEVFRSKDVLNLENGELFKAWVWWGCRVRSWRRQLYGWKCR